MKVCYTVTPSSGAVISYKIICLDIDWVNSVPFGICFRSGSLKAEPEKGSQVQGAVGRVIDGVVVDAEQGRGLSWSLASA